jgi:hypothetical protein
VRPLGSSELKTVELPDQLQFVYGYEPGWGDLAAPPAALLVALAWALSEHHLVYAAIFVVIFISLVIYWLNISPAKLSVTQRELIAQGSQNRNLNNQTTIPTSEVNSLAYAAAAKGTPAGLYAVCRRNQACLLPGLTQEQAAAVAELIRTKFPKLERGDNIPIALQYPEQHSKG